MKRFASYFRTKILIFCLLFVNISFLFSSETDISYIYAQLDGAFSQKSSQQVSDILKKNSDSEHYKLFESYALKKTRQLIIENELELARQTALAVIDNNIDNFDAVALYTSIDTAIKERDAKIKAEEERRQIEEMRIMANTAKEQKQIKKEYQTISNTSSGETVYLDTDYNTHYLPLSWAINVGMADLALYTDPREVGGKFGFSSFGNVYFHSEDYIIGGDYFLDTMLFNFGGDAEEEQHLDTTVNLTFGYSHESIIRNFYFLKFRERF